MATPSSDDNPLPVNVVPMVDVIFCLCVFFLCCFRARESEGRLDTWLPRECGLGSSAAGLPLSELRVHLEEAGAPGRLRWRFQARDLAGPEELEPLLRAAREEGLARHEREQPLILDAGPGVPWSAAMRVVDLGRELGIPELQLALGPAGRP